MANNFSCILLNVYLPCDNYSANIVTREYEQCVEYIEGLLSTTDCNTFICCGDYNTSLKRGNAQCRFLQDFVSRNNLTCSWNHALSREDYTYCNYALGQKSIIDHFIVSKKYFRCYCR